MAQCPECKEPVSQFAAGCAVCGFDLEGHRRQRVERRQVPGVGRRPRLPAVPEDVVTFVLIAIAILALPILGLVLAGLAIHRQRMSTQGPLRVALYALVLVGCSSSSARRRATAC